MIIKMSFTWSKTDVRIYIVLMTAIKKSKKKKKSTSVKKKKSDENCYEIPITSELLIKIMTLAISSSDPEATEVLTRPTAKRNWQ